MEIRTAPSRIYDDDVVGRHLFMRVGEHRDFPPLSEIDFPLPYRISQRIVLKYQNMSNWKNKQ